jgi:UDP-N-acetylglucosamine--N-acetylmuramyl-(pentapeptide) pyrophosphoryl-undecaprenol N-acetylglucosamine transferase
VVGGSLGAVALNERLAPALAALPVEQRPQVRHQAGKDREGNTAANYNQHGVSAEVSPFIDDMAAAYEWADLVVCRSGALTVAELAAAAKPALLVPFPFAVDDHQRINAQVLVKAGAAKCVVQSELTVERLSEFLSELLVPNTLAAMAAKARQAAHLDATKRLAEGCLEMVPLGDSA